MDVDPSPWRLILHFLNDIRLSFNRSLDHLEPWQVVMYTCSFIIFTQWLRKVAKLDESVSISRSWHNLLINLPYYREKFDLQKQAARKEIEEKLMRGDVRREFYKFLPEKGLGVTDIVAEAVEYKAMGDTMFARGRVAGASFAADDDDQARLTSRIFELFSHSNANFPDIYPACRKMEAEVIRMLCSLFHGGSRSCGMVTTSAGETAILSCLAYRNCALKQGIRKPEIILGRNADVTFAKAAKLLGMRIVNIPVDTKYQMDLGAIKRAISRETCVIVVSAPSCVSGVMDDVERVAELATRYGIPVHVDACSGGFLLPFMEQCDYAAPMFDFRLSGVASIGVDLHKYGYAPIGSSAVLYREQFYLKEQCFSDIHWPGGIYVSPTLSSSRPGSLIALTWATLLYNGRLGFVERTQKVLDATHSLKEKLQECHFVEILGEPLLTSVTFRTTDERVHSHVLGDYLNDIGWNLAFLQSPDALRFSVSMRQASDEIIDEFIEDLTKSYERLENHAAPEQFPAKTNVFFGVSSSFIDRGIADDMPNMYLDAFYATPLIPRRSNRTLSIEGRKLSHIPGSSSLTSLQEAAAQHVPTGPVKFSSNLEPTQEDETIAA